MSDPIDEPDASENTDETAQTPTPASAEDKAHQKLIQELDQQRALVEKQQALLTAQTELKKAQAASLTAGLPEASPITPPTGTVEVSESKTGYFAELVAYRALQDAAAAVGTAIDNKPLTGEPVKILIVDSLQVAQGDFPGLHIQAALKHYKARMLEQRAADQALLAPLAAKEDDLIPGVDKLQGFSPAVGGIAAIAAVATAVPSLLGAAADVFSYFKLDFTLYSRDVTIPDEALKAMVAGKITKYPVVLLHFHWMQESPLLHEMMALFALRLDLSVEKGRLESLSENEKAAQAATVCQVLISNLDDFVKGISTSAQADSPSPLVLAIQRDALRHMGITHLLYLKTNTSGGETLIKKGLWTRGGETSFVGGGAVSYLLAQTDGRIVAADTVVAAAQVDHQLGKQNAAAFHRIKWD